MPTHSAQYHWGYNRNLNVYQYQLHGPETILGRTNVYQEVRTASMILCHLVLWYFRTKYCFIIFDKSKMALEYLRINLQWWMNLDLASTWNVFQINYEPPKVLDWDNDSMTQLKNNNIIPEIITQQPHTNTHEEFNKYKQ